nr:isoform 7 of histone-lysine n-methyltransferase 2e [Quercus suber]
MSDLLELTDETGTVLNEYYTIDEYVNRRSWYLSKLPSLAKQTRFFYGVREIDAAAVYGSGDQILSVQEVRRREEASLVSPLLPLPTTDNTQTIDSYGHYSGREWTAQTSPLTLFPHPAVSSYANRGVSILVKSRGQKRKHPEDDENVGSNKNQTAGSKRTSPSPVAMVVGADSPQRKFVKLKLRNRAALKAKPSTETTSARCIKRRKTNTKSSSVRTSTAKSTAGATNNTAPVQNPRGKPSQPPYDPSKRIILQRRAARSIIDRIVAGTRLPFTPEEAQQASSLRYQRLLAAQRPQPPIQKQRPHPAKPSTSSSTTTPHHSRPDILPEFHFPHNFTPRGAEDAVRCICAATHDDGAAMLACERCDAWQHIECMRARSSVPERPADEPYACHVCDPFAHRLFLARWRVEHPLED